jgi:hypothetical protein
MVNVETVIFISILHENVRNLIIQNWQNLFPSTINILLDKKEKMKPFDAPFFLIRKKITNGDTLSMKLFHIEL